MLPNAKGFNRAEIDRYHVGPGLKAEQIDHNPSGLPSRNRL